MAPLAPPGSASVPNTPKISNDRPALVLSTHMTSMPCEIGSFQARYVPPSVLFRQLPNADAAWTFVVDLVWSSGSYPVKSEI